MCIPSEEEKAFALGLMMNAAEVMRYIIKNKGLEGALEEMNKLANVPKKYIGEPEALEQEILDFWNEAVLIVEYAERDSSI